MELHRAVSVEFGGTAAHPGVVESQFGLVNAVQRPQVTTLGREAYPTFPEKVAAFIFALLTYSPFRGGNRRVALASLFSALPPRVSARRRGRLTGALVAVLARPLAFALHTADRLAPRFL